MTEIVDIFIKTYHKDFIWLEYCLRSIKKFASGFRDVVIVSDDDGNMIPANIAEIIPLKIHYVPLPSKTPTESDHGLGYSWQQYIKLSWYDYTDADAVLHIDSDRMFTNYVTPETFKLNGKYTWYYRDWDKAGDGICHKSHTDKILKVDTKFDAMITPTFIFIKSTSIALKNHLISAHSNGDVSIKTIWDVIVLLNMKTLSEFNIFGSFLYHYDRSEYCKLINDKTSNYQPIIGSWSWGGLKEQDKERREKILAS